MRLVKRESARIDGKRTRNKTQSCKTEKMEMSKVHQNGNICIYLSDFILLKMSSAIDFLEIFPDFNEIIFILITSIWILVLPSLFVLFCFPLRG